jgi:hypothetical protein
MAQDAPATYRDIETTLGSAPTFFKLFPEGGYRGSMDRIQNCPAQP